MPPGGGVGLLEDGPGPLRVVGHGALDPRERLAVAGLAGQHLLEEREGAGRRRGGAPPGARPAGCGARPPPRPSPRSRPRRSRRRGRRRRTGRWRRGAPAPARAPPLRRAPRRGPAPPRARRAASPTAPPPSPSRVHADPAGAQPRVGGLLGAARPGGGLVALLVEELGHLAPRLACAVGVAQPVARHLGDLPPELPADAEVALQPRPAPQRRDQRRPGLAGAVDARQRGLGLDGGLVGQPLLHRAGEDLDQPLLGPGRVGEPAQLRPQPRLGGRIPALERVLARPRLEGRAESFPAPSRSPASSASAAGRSPAGMSSSRSSSRSASWSLVSGGPVDLLEQPGRGGAGAGARERARQAGERRALLRELLQHRGEGVDRRLGVLHPLEQHGAPEQDLEPPRRVVPPRLRELRRGPERARRCAAPGRGSGRAPPAARRRRAPPRPACARRRPVRPRRRCVPGCAPTGAGSRTAAAPLVASAAAAYTSASTSSRPDFSARRGMSASASSRSRPPAAKAPRAASSARDGSPRSTSRSVRISPWRCARSAGSSSAASRSSRTVSRVSTSCADANT